MVTVTMIAITMIIVTTIAVTVIAAVTSSLDAVSEYYRVRRWMWR